MTMEMSSLNRVSGGMRRVVRLAAILNLAYFGVEFAVAMAIGSVSLFADSIDFLEDTAVNFLILLALDWSARSRARMGVALSGAGPRGASSPYRYRLHHCRSRWPGPARLR
jgi:Co/Zn/Cd efflux system component